MINLSPEELDAIVQRTLPQLPEGHAGGFVLDVGPDAATFVAELEKDGDGWTLKGEAAAQFKYHPLPGEQALSAGTRLLFSWK